MTDVFSKEKRSEVMSKVRSVETGPEILVRSELWKRGLRYRKYYGSRKIDIAFPSKKVAVFIDSCFWHSCPEHGELPKANRRFWKEKFDKTKKRDKEATRELQVQGWTVIRIWVHSLKEGFEGTIDQIEKAVASANR